MEANFNDYTIDTIDIWPYEAQQFLSENRSDEHILHLKSILENLIIKTRKEQIQLNKTITIEPFVTVADYDNDSNKEYWIRHVKEFKNATSLKDQVRLHYFNILDKGIDSFFSLTQEITIDRKNDDFDFWFAMKLGQYKDCVKYISNFLNYQLKVSFKRNFQKMEGFLILLICQYEGELLSEKVVKITQNWINKESNSVKEKKQAKNEINKGEEIEKTIHKTFYLDIVRSQPSILKKETAFIEAFQILTNNGLISLDTPVDNFNAIFQSKPLEEGDFIKWIGTLIELKWLIQQICKKGICSHIIGIEKWKVAQNCFLITADGKWRKIEKHTQISNANGATKNKKYIDAFGVKIKSILYLPSDNT